MSHIVKTAVVTGAASGIGRATVERLARGGWHVVGVDVELGETVRVLGDVAEETTWRAAVDAVRERSDRLDALVHNAGINVRGSVEEIDLATWQRIIAVNLTAVFLGTKHCVPLLRDSRGCIVNVASGAGLVGTRRTPAYTASKGGVIALTRQLAVEYALDGIRVNAVCPGVVDTPMVRRLAEGAADPTAEIDRLAQGQVIGRLGQPEEIAATIDFLCSDAASFITGAIIPADGGYTAR